ncbi:Glutathione-dependent formaldehyde-activating enzyme/centromere protein V [Penicillium fimorum]|uniref:Glutathione-dependent formaldehyde-activating enzyme/centromere protein V n=1 Tax=Penicillium fimorum TaxID=1882269 RepID=A0A9X0CB92_9EURO|nr:Glutathione-dependent formaldehyde-activating enzyme/centromere protein V [Penicillium fimorum]
MGMKARCQCGKIQFTTPTDKPLKLWICHCTECQHQSSSAFGITATFPYFELPESVSGMVSSYTRFTLKGRDMECLFCKNCGARLLHRFRDAVPAPGEQPEFSAITNVKGGCLEDLNKEMLRTAVHIWCQEAIIDIPEGVEKWDQAPPQPNPLVN